MVFALDYINSVNNSSSQLSHVQAMTVQDVYTLITLCTLMGLYLSEASGHQKTYKEILAHIDDGHALTIDKVQHEIIRFSHSRPPRAFAHTHSVTLRFATTTALVAVTHVARRLVLHARVRPLACTPPAATAALVVLFLPLIFLSTPSGVPMASTRTTTFSPQSFRETA
jgi:hypothetical protein